MYRDPPWRRGSKSRRLRRGRMLQLSNRHCKFLAALKISILSPKFAENENFRAPDFAFSVENFSNRTGKSKCSPVSDLLGGKNHLFAAGQLGRVAVLTSHVLSRLPGGKFRFTQVTEIPSQSYCFTCIQYTVNHVHWRSHRGRHQGHLPRPPSLEVY